MRERREPMLSGEANLAARIGQERQSRGMSLAQLAERMNMTPPMPTTAVYRIEKGLRSIRVDELLALSEALDLPVLDLLTPIELLGRQDAERIADRVTAGMAAVHAAGRELAAALAELRTLHAEAPEAGEYLLNLLAAPFWAIDHQRERKTLPPDDRTSIEAAVDDAADTLIGDTWDAVYEGAAKRFGYFIGAEGVGFVPDPAKPMRDNRR